MTEQDFLAAVGRGVRTLRKNSGLTQVEVSRRAGVPQGALSNFENRGAQIKGIDIIKRIVEATNHTMRDLMDVDVLGNSPTRPTPEEK